MSGHTPGPWDYATETLYGKNGEEPNYLVGRDSDPVAKVFKYHDGIQNYSAEANARLIASAPALLEALEDAVKQLSEYHKCSHDIDPANAGHLDACDMGAIGEHGGCAHCQVVKRAKAAIRAAKGE